MRSTETTDRRARTPRARAVRFGFGALLVIGGLGAYLWLGRESAAAGGALLAAGASILLLALIAPRAALAVRGAWMAVARAIGWVNTRILLGAVFIVVVTPIALIRRALRHDPLRLRWSPGGRESYWEPRGEDHDPKHHERPY